MIITQTPLRMSFVGGGSDLRSFYEISDGHVLSTTIDKYIYIIVKERYDNRIVLAWSKKENVTHVDEIQHELIRESMKLVGIDRGIEIITTADIPSEGSGLGSSSSLTVGLLHALHLYIGEPVSAQQLAQEAVKIEIDILKKPIGKQDHYAAALGGFREYVFKKNETVETQKFNLSLDQVKLLEQHLILLYTNRTRSANKILEAQKNRTTQNVEILQKMLKCIPQMKEAIAHSRMQEVGTILNEQWQAKKQLAAQISDAEIDALYTQALTQGAWGGKILGAGGGGFLLLVCPPEKRDHLKQQLKNYPEMPIALNPDGSRAIFNIKRKTWKI